jgi:hypothetical protein
MNHFRRLRIKCVVGTVKTMLARDEFVLARVK